MFLNGWFCSTPIFLFYFSFILFVFLAGICVGKLLFSLCEHRLIFTMQNECLANIKKNVIKSYMREHLYKYTKCNFSNNINKNIINIETD